MHRLQSKCPQWQAIAGLPALQHKSRDQLVQQHNSFAATELNLYQQFDGVLFGHCTPASAPLFYTVFPTMLGIL